MYIVLGPNPLGSPCTIIIQCMIDDIHVHHAVILLDQVVCVFLFLGESPNLVVHDGSKQYSWQGENSMSASVGA